MVWVVKKVSIPKMLWSFFKSSSGIGIDSLRTALSNALGLGRGDVDCSAFFP